MDTRWLERSTVPVQWGPGALARLGPLARGESARHALLISDPGVVAAGHVERAARSLAEAGIPATIFADIHENPTTEDVARGVEAASAAGEGIDLVIGLGGGSAMDCAKGVNLLLSNGGRVEDYWGVDKPVRPLLPSILIPTTAGTGSEAQSFALISDARTHQKMACGDRRSPGGLRPRWAILDPELTRSQPKRVAAMAGMDALVHAIETAGTRVATPESLACARAAWELLDRHYPDALQDQPGDETRAAMLAGAHFAGAAIERSMLGAAHACANPLTAHFGVPHGVAVGLVTPHVIRFNAAAGGSPYRALMDDAEALARKVEELIRLAGFAPLRAFLAPEADWPRLAEEAACQWTAGFNPRPVDAACLLEVYRAALAAG